MAPRKTANKAGSKSKGSGEKRKVEDVEDKSVQPERKEETAADEGGDPDQDREEGEPPKKAAKTSSPLEWLLGEEAFNMANPEIPKGHGEVDWEDGPHKKTPPPQSAGKSPSGNDDILRYPKSHLTPFQNLIAACLLSKPISHKLGLRTIQTLLNPPFGIRTLSDLDEAGYEGRRKVMWEARTQHKEKTAGQLGDVAEGVRELCGDKDKEEDLSEMTGIRDQLKGLSASDAAQKTEDILTQIKGIGPGVAAIFLRRVQGDWTEVFPYADDRSLKAARHFGLIGNGDGADKLAELVNHDEKDFVRLLDTLIGLDLEKVLEDAVERAGAA